MTDNGQRNLPILYFYFHTNKIKVKEAPKGPGYKEMVWNVQFCHESVVEWSFIAVLLLSIVKQI